MRLGCLLLVVLLMAGCHAVGPDYKRPPAPVPLAWQAQGPWRPADPKDSIPKSEWWKIFRNPELDRLLASVVAANQDLNASAARIQQARALALMAVSKAYPQVSVGPSFERYRLSRNRPSAGAPVQSALTQNAWVFPSAISYEPDLFGRIRRGSESSNASYQASAADFENLKLILTAEAATDYFTLSRLDTEIQILDDTIASLEKALTLIKNRHDGGIASGLDLLQEQSLLDATRAQATLQRSLRATYEHALATLCGQPASDFRIARSQLQKFLPEIAVGVPSDVLERRPDISRAERRMAASNADIGVAKSAFYPSFGLITNAGFQSTSLLNLATLPSSVWALGSAVAQSVFSGGRNRAGLAFAETGYQASVAEYRQTVLTAFQEVEDALTALQVLDGAAKSQDAAVGASRRALEIAMNRYTGGLVTYLDVVTAQQTLLANERQLAQIQGNQLVNSVMLVKALGGGWDAASLTAIGVHPRLKSALQP